MSKRAILLWSYVVLGLALAGVLLAAAELALGVGHPRTNALCVAGGLFIAACNVARVRRWR